MKNREEKDREEKDREEKDREEKDREEKDREEKDGGMKSGEIREKNRKSGVKSENARIGASGEKGEKVRVGVKSGEKRGAKSGAGSGARRERVRNAVKVFFALLLALVLVLSTLTPLLMSFGETDDDRLMVNGVVDDVLREDRLVQHLRIRLGSGAYDGLYLETVYDRGKSEVGGSNGATGNEAQGSKGAQAPLATGDKVIVSLEKDRGGAISRSFVVGKGEMANVQSMMKTQGKVVEVIEESEAHVQTVKVELRGSSYKGVEVVVPFDRDPDKSGQLLAPLKAGDGVAVYVETDKYGAVKSAYAMTGGASSAQLMRVGGTVTSVIEEKVDSVAKTHTQIVRVRFHSDVFKGLECIAQFERNAYFNEGYLLEPVEEGTEVILQVERDMYGAVSKAYVADVKREHLIWWLVALFFICLLLVGGLKGVKAIVSLLVTGIMVFFVFIPLILRGHNPVLLSILVCIFVVAVSFLIISGVHRKTLAATAGTVFGIVIAGVLFLIFTELMRISGITTEHARMLLFIPQKIQLDFKGLLFAGVLIASMGASMDIGMTVASTVNEVGINSPDIKRFALFKAGLNVGRDAMATMTNTLILAYVGTSLNMVLLLSANSIQPIVYLNWEILAVEIARALTATIGLVSAIPITAFIAAELFDKKRK